MDVEFNGRLLEKKRESGFPPGLEAPVASGVAGLSVAAGVDERRAVTISTPETPSRETGKSYQLTHIPFAPWCRACAAGRSREDPYFRQVRGEEMVVTPVVSLDYVTLGLYDRVYGEGTTLTLALCDENTTYSLGLMVSRKGPVPHAVRGVCVFLQESGYTRMILKSDGKPSITALVTAVQKEWASDCKDFLRQMIPRASPVDVHASKEAVEAMMHSLEGLTRTSKGGLGRGSGNLDPAYLSDPAVAGETSELPTKPICCTSVRQNILRRVDHVKVSESSDQL